MEILNSLPAGTIVKLKKADKRVVIMGIMQQAMIDDKIENFDYIGVPYPEGYLGENQNILFQEDDIELIQSMGFSDIERQQFIVGISEILKNVEAHKEEQ